MEHDPIANDARKARRQRRLGPDVACVLCSTTTPEVLVLINRSVLEAHHVAGVANDAALTVPVCRNCHALLSADQLSRGAPLAHAARRTLPEQVAAVLSELAAFCYRLGDRLAMWADRLYTCIDAFDVHFPTWRELPEMYA
jgi:hypothetical protein